MLKFDFVFEAIPLILIFLGHENCGPGNSVGIATDYGMGGPGLNPGGGENFRTPPDRPWGPTNLLYNLYGVLPGGKAAGAWS
jgi:hypothetical protein